jgi:hypothetical protein
MGCCPLRQKQNKDTTIKSQTPDTIKSEFPKVVIENAHKRRLKQSLTENLVLEVFDRDLNDFYETTEGQVLGNVFFRS